MLKSSFKYQTAFFLSLGISLLLNFLFFIMFIYGRDAVLPPEGHPRPKLEAIPMLGHFFFNFLMAFVLYMINFSFIKTKLSVSSTHSQQKWWMKWWVIVLFTFILTGILSYIFSLIQLHWNDYGPHSERFIRGGMFRDYFISVIVLFSSQLMYLNYKQQQIALENEILVAENMKTRFTALKNQVDPHFLFNSLNTLNSLIKMDADKAQEYVQQLSYVFRYTLQNKEIITLEEELRFTQSYCHLMKIRYGESLKFEHQIDEKYNSYFIIPLSLQTLVENAIKHNIVSNKHPMTILIATTDDSSITVSNPLQPKKEAEAGEGIGLSNLQERYRLMWNKDIVIKNTKDTFAVTIPLKQSNV